MKKKLYIALIILVVLAGVVYFTGLYTYFVRKDVQEALPMPSSSVETQKVIVQGMFGEVDFVHKGSGIAKLIEVDGRTILRLENFNVVSGPDLYVYLSETTSPTGDIASLGNFLDLGTLKGTSGNQNYEIPGDSGNRETAIIWCKRYGVLFTYA